MLEKLIAHYDGIIFSSVTELIILLILIHQMTLLSEMGLWGLNRSIIQISFILTAGEIYIKDLT